MAVEVNLATQFEERLLERNQVCEEFFARQSGRLAQACREMSERFQEVQASIYHVMREGLEANLGREPDGGSGE